MAPRLISLFGYPNITLGRVLTNVGRDREADARVDSSRVSRRHCCLVVDLRGIVVRDLKSTNGTFINGVRVVEGVLRDGEVLGVGHLRYRLEMDLAPGSPLAKDRGVAGVPTPSQADGPSIETSLDTGILGDPAGHDSHVASPQ